MGFSGKNILIEHVDPGRITRADYPLGVVHRKVKLDTPYRQPVSGLALTEGV